MAAGKTARPVPAEGHPGARPGWAQEKAAHGARPNNNGCGKIHIIEQRKDMEKILKSNEASALAELAVDWQRNHPEMKVAVTRRRDWMDRDIMEVRVDDGDYRTVSVRSFILADRLLDAAGAFALTVSDINGKEGKE